MFSRQKMKERRSLIKRIEESAGESLNYFKKGVLTNTFFKEEALRLVVVIGLVFILETLVVIGLFHYS